jgi:hypothetical protein
MLLRTRIGVAAIAIVLCGLAAINAEPKPGTSQESASPKKKSAAGTKAPAAKTSATKVNGVRVSAPAPAPSKTELAPKDAAPSSESQSGVTTGEGTTAASADAFEIGGLQPCLGPYGPARNTDTFFAGETLTYRFDVSQPRLNADRKFNVAFSYRLLDESGKPQVAESYPVEGRLWIDLERVRYHLEFKLPDDLAAGSYSLELGCIDNEAGKQATVSRPLEVEPAEFALVSTRFYYDQATTIPAPAGGLQGQDLHFQVEVLGEDRSQGKAHLVFEMHVLDEAGREVSHLEPIAWQHDAPAFLDDRAKHPLFSGHLALLRAGNFVLRLTAIDKTTGATTSQDTALRVATIGE